MMFADAWQWMMEQIAEAVMPPPVVSVVQWCEDNIIISAESGSPHPGPLSFKRTPYVIAPLKRMEPSDPCRHVNVVAAAQTGKSLIPQCWVAFSIANNPGPIGVYLPTRDEAKKYSNLKLQTMIDATPALRHRVAKVSSRSSENSNAFAKRFPGGTVQILNAGSPNSLQMVSFRDLILEEVAGYEEDVGGRGKPSEQAKKRQRSWEKRGAKTMSVSAAGIMGKCEVTTLHGEGTAHEIYLPCVHCAGFNRWEFDDMNAPTPTVGPHFTCKLCGGVIEYKHLEPMLEGHIFVPTFEEPGDEAPPRAFEPEERARWEGRDEKRRQPSYRWWAYVSTMVDWLAIWEEAQSAKKKGLDAEKVFYQQTLALPWDEGRDAPDHSKLHELREDYPEGEVPAGVYLLTGFADVQGDHLPWSVYGWAPGAEWFLIDRGKCMGDPSGEEVWKELAGVLAKRYPHVEGGSLPIELFGIDTGFKTNHVYNFVNKHPTARALDGRDGWNRPYIGKPTRVKGRLDGRHLSRTSLYPTATWPIKSELQHSLTRTLNCLPGLRIGGRGHFHMGCDVDYFRELCAEMLVEERKKKLVRVWQVRPGFRNEETDIWVGSRALAWGLGVGAPKEFDWEAARAKLLAEPQSDLFAPRRVSAPSPAGDDDEAADEAEEIAAELATPAPPADDWGMSAGGFKGGSR